MNRPPAAAFLLGLAVLAAAGCRRDDAPGWASGTVECDVVRVASRHGGRVERVAVREGDLVAAGQLVAELSAEELPAQLAQARAALAELEAGARPEEVAAARAELAAAESEASLAESDAARQRRLGKDGVASAQELDRAEARARASSRQAAASRARLDLLLAGARAERVAQARARVRELEASSAELRVVAPSGAVVESLPAKAGDVLAPNREVATLLPTNRLWVRVYVPQPWIGHLRPGDPAEVRADAFPGRRFAGRVEQVAREAEFTPRNVQTPGDRVRQVFGIKVALPAGDDGLRAGMSVDARFPSVPAAIAGEAASP